jgi:sigma-B regulation protein RsbQ
VSVLTRNNVQVHGPADGQPMLFAHGFGCDQSMWRFVWPAFSDRYRIVLFDHVGYGGSDASAFDPRRHSSLEGYADDVVAICDELGYVGGFSEEDIAGLLESLESNYLGWSSTMAPVIMGNPDRPELSEELTNSFCRTDPAIAAAFARATFLGDNRRDLERVRTPTLVLQASDDVIAPLPVGEYVHDRLPDSQFVLLDAIGHCPNLSAPDQTIAAIERFLAT